MYAVATPIYFSLDVKIYQYIRNKTPSATHRNGFVHLTCCLFPYTIVLANVRSGLFDNSPRFKDVGAKILQLIYYYYIILIFTAVR